MKRAAITLAVGLAIIIVPFAARADASNRASDVVIVELQTTGTNDAKNQEFIELYNASSDTIDLGTWELQYFSAGSSMASPSKRIALSGTITQGIRYLVASNDYLNDTADTQYSSGLTREGGHIRLASADPANSGQWMVHDLVGWGTAAHPEGSAAPVPLDGKSLKRVTDQDGYFLDTNNNIADFTVSTEPTPESTMSLVVIEPEVEPDANPEPPAEPTPEPMPEPELPATTDTETQTEDIPSEPATLLPPVVTELLPNPASPQTDDKDEFVELYNPNPTELALKDMKLQTGSSFGHSFTFKIQTIAANSYLAVYVSESSALLSNSTSQARVIDEVGQAVSVSDVYVDAPEGESWALIDGTWQWTTTPTPGAANVLTLPAVKAASVSATKKTTAKKATVKKAAATKKSTTTSNDRTEYQEPEGDGETAPVHPGILAGMGVAAVGYAGYEYRHDMGNRLNQLRRYRENRRARRK